MIAVKLQGRLGNQLFQYATAFALAKEHNTYVVLDFLDYDMFVTHSRGIVERARILFLDEYNVVAQYGSFFIPSSKFRRRVNSLFSLCEELRLPEKFLQIIRNLRSYALRIYLLKLIRDHNPKRGYSDTYVQSIFRAGKNVYLDGWFQCHKFFQKYRSDLLHHFTPCNPISKYSMEQETYILTKKESVGVHIRRTDVVKTGDVLSLEYYFSAIKYMQRTLQNSHFFFFSDDPQWVKQQSVHFSGFHYTILDGNPIDKGHEDLYLLSTCRHQIIANSTFSWWGAWLNTNKDKIVIMPHVFSEDKNTHILNDVDVPDDWVKLRV